MRHGEVPLGERTNYLLRRLRLVGVESLRPQVAFVVAPAGVAKGPFVAADVRRGSYQDAGLCWGFAEGLYSDSRRLESLEGRKRKACGQCSRTVSPPECGVWCVVWSSW